MSHWENIYESKPTTDVSWYEHEPTTSLAHIASVVGHNASIIDVGAGASFLVDRLIELGHRDVAVLDVSSAALTNIRQRFEGADVVPEYIVTDVTHWQPSRTWDLWHDRAVYHFMVTDEMRAGYARAMAGAVRVGGFAVVATFSLDGPEQCSGITVVRHSTAELAARFERNFDLVHAAEHVHSTPWGAAQPFSWVVLRRR